METTLGRGIGEYRKNSVNSASPVQLVVLLYDAALRHCEAALAAIGKQDLECQHDNLSKAQRVVAELASSLDMEKGGEVAGNLFGLYSYCLDRLADANINDSPQPIREAIDILCQLRQAWQHILENGTEITNAT